MSADMSKMSGAFAAMFSSDTDPNNSGNVLLITCEYQIPAHHLLMYLFITCEYLLVTLEYSCSSPVKILMVLLTFKYFQVTFIMLAYLKCCSSHVSTCSSLNIFFIKCCALPKNIKMFTVHESSGLNYMRISTNYSTCSQVSIFSSHVNTGTSSHM
jgi:hypothetical protein